MQPNSRHHRVKPENRAARARRDRGPIYLDTLRPSAGAAQSSAATALVPELAGESVCVSISAHTR